MEETKKIKLPHIILPTAVVPVLVQYSLLSVNYILSHCCVFNFNTVTTSALLGNEKLKNLMCERCHVRELQKFQVHPQILYKVSHCSIILYCTTIFFPTTFNDSFIK
jgi:hypothetical protein